MKSIIKIIIAGLILMGGYISVNAQKSLDIFSQYKKQFPTEHGITLKSNVDVNIKQKGEDVQIDADYYEENLFLDVDGGDYSTRSLYYTDLEQISDLKATTFVADGSHTKEMAVKNFLTKDYLDDGIFYGSGKVINFIFPGIVNQSRTVLSYHTKYLDPHLLSPLELIGTFTTANSSVKLSFPSSVQVKYQMFGIDDSIKNKITFSEEKKGGSTTYTWTAHDLKHKDEESGAPAYAEEQPQIIFYIERTEYKGVQKDVLANTADLYKWCHDLAAKTDNTKSPAFIHLVDSLTKTAKDNTEKAKRVYQWVQDNIHYVAFENGYEGYIPRACDQVFSKRYGDCKDMANLIVNMLQVADVPADMTWIGTRDVAYTQKDLSTPMLFNHMIASAMLDGKRVYLDGTGSYTAFGYPTTMIQGREGMIGNGSTYELVKVPEIPKEFSQVIDSMDITYTDNKISGTGSSTFKGYDKEYLMYQIKNKDDKEKTKYLSKFLGEGNNKCSVDNITTQGDDSRDAPVYFNYTVSIPDYVTSTDNELYVNLNLNKYLQDEDVDTALRKLPIEYNYKHELHTRYKFKLPDTYSVDYLPPNAEYNGKDFGFAIKYKKEEGYISLDKSVYVDELVMNTNEFGAWNDMIKQINKAYKETVVLKKGK